MKVIRLVYFIVEIKMKAKPENKQAYVKYVERVRAIVEKYEGRYLARGGKITAVFGGWKPQRIIIIEFPHLAAVKKWLNSAEYKKIAVLRENSAFTKAIVVEGCA